MRFTINRRGEERWSFELARSLEREDEMLAILASSGKIELADDCDCGNCSPTARSKRPPFGFSR